MSSATLPNDLLVNRLAEFFGNPESPIPADPKIEPEPERDAGGKFRNGNRGGPGNPYARRVAKLRQAMLEECAEEDLRAMTRAMIERAKAGDAAAARLVFQYALGKPSKTVDPDRVDQDEWDVLSTMAVPMQVVNPMLETLPADAANRLVQKMWPVFVQMFSQVVRKKAAELAEAEKEAAAEAAEWERMSPEEKEAIEAAFRKAAEFPSPNGGSPSPNGFGAPAGTLHRNGSAAPPSPPPTGSPQRGK